MKITQDIGGCLAGKGDSQRLEKAAFEKALSTIHRADKRLREEVSSGNLPLFQPYEAQHPTVASINALAARIRERFRHIVVIGTGGSSLCPKTLCALRERGNPMIHFENNLDPVTVEKHLNWFAPKNTFVLAISKSGATMETLSLFAVYARWLQKAGLPLEDHIAVLTDPQDNPLRRIAATLRLPVLNHEPHIGGRFSIFTNVGLLPAAIAGVNAAGILQGARRCMEQWTASEEIQQAAALHLAFMRSGKRINVIMPYANRLEPYAQWVRQIWAESLGKGGEGSTPVGALGALDQHSQLQLFLDGPKDHYFTLLLPTHSHDVVVNIAFLKEPALDYMDGKPLAELMHASQFATRDSMIHHGLPVRVLHTGRVNEETLGYLCMQAILETVLVGYALDLNPFDQPAVEDGKVRAREYLKKL